ncbi:MULTISPECIES: hypothetical protein [Phenylobacterium]|uniref:Uncharacterized protein n=1 Tax=Phenylobacterium koreense TaxID=266125 RepID=A0ABV2EF52_9CAUL
MKPKPPPPLYEDPGPDLLQDGQEEVFSHKAVERGLTHDPRALGPDRVDGEDLPECGSESGDK